MKHYKARKLRGNQNASKRNDRQPRHLLERRSAVRIDNRGTNQQRQQLPQRLGVFAEALSGYKHNGKLTTGYTL
jgi:hypothetical protein